MTRLSVMYFFFSVKTLKGECIIHTVGSNVVILLILHIHFWIYVSGKA